VKQAPSKTCPLQSCYKRGHARRTAVLVCDLVLGLATRAVVNEASDGLRERLNEEINAFHVAAAGLADGRLLGITAREKGGELCAGSLGGGGAGVVTSRFCGCALISVDVA
jgi:hypothetical protein